MEADINQEVDPERDLREPPRRAFELNKANIVAFTLCDEDDNLGLKNKVPDTRRRSDRAFRRDRKRSMSADTKCSSNGTLKFVYHSASQVF